MKKEKIALDIDGVLADLTSAVVLKINDRFGLYTRYQDITDYRYENNFSEGKLRERVGELVKGLDLFDNLEPIHGAPQAVAALLEAGHEVYAVTARGKGFGVDPGQVRLKTMKWLAYEGMAVNGLVFTTRGKKSAAAKGCAVLVDDHLSTVRAAAKANKKQKVFLFDQPWNQDDKLPESVERVSGWDELLPILLGGAE